MKKMQKTLFISDLHLHETHPDTTQLLQMLLNRCDQEVDALYILGDLFEMWIGDDDHSPFHQEIIQSFKQLTQAGFPIFFLHGNRDFLIGKKFFESSGIIPLAEEEKIFLYGTPILLMHGDTLCTRDIDYLKARNKLRNKFLQKVFLFLPLSFRKKIADHFRLKSRAYTQSAPLNIMDVTQEDVEKVMQKHNVNYLIHGHTHRPNFHYFTIENKQALRIVLGDWHKHGSVLEWNETGEKELVELL